MNNKRTKGENVYQLVQKRLKFLFNEFDNIYVSFSGGKDSGVLLNLCIQYIREHNLDRKIGVYHMDYEAQYQMTTEYVEQTFRENQDILEIYHVCVPFKVVTCASMFQTYWRPWDESMHAHWVRPMPKNCYKKEDFPFYNEEMWDYTFQKDIWTAYARFKWPFNQMYELYYKAGVPLDRQRVASPFLSTAQETLKLYKAIDPNTWGRMLGRVNGVNFTGIYGGTRAMGWQNIKLPEGYTWKEYMYFLLDTLPEETKQSYLEKLRVSREFWKYKGGCLDLSTIRKLTDLGIKFYVQKKTNYKTDKLPVQMDYLDDIDIAEFKEIPTYKRMCICILKNDHVCKYMGFALTKKEKLRRDRVMQKYKNIIK